MCRWIVENQNWKKLVPSEGRSGTWLYCEWAESLGLGDFGRFWCFGVEEPGTL